MENLEKNSSDGAVTINNANDIVISEMQPLNLSSNATITVATTAIVAETTTSTTTNLHTTNENVACSQSNSNNKLLLDVPSTSAAAAAATAAATGIATDSGTNSKDSVSMDHPSTTSTTTTATNTTATTVTTTTTTTSLECPICLQTCIHPAQLPCGHIFCFLCVKGVAYKNKRCAMCRREIPTEFLNHPQLVNGIEDIFSTKTTEDGYQWFYEGRNGWWQYDDRTSQDIEDAYKKGEKSCIILVAGYVYIVDLEAMIQQRQNEPSRCRRVKRDLATIPKKGVAGLRIEDNIVTTTETNFPNHLQEERDLPDNSLSARRPRSLLTSSISHDSLESYIDNLDLGRGSLSNVSVGNPTEFVSTMAATDAAIRIASDIIGSTLAHADELTRQNRVEMHTLHSPTSNQLDNDITNIRGELNELRLSTRLGTGNMVNRNEQLALTAAAGRAAVLERGSRELLGAAEDLLGATQRVLATADQLTINLFEQTLDDFHALTLRNLIDSQTDNDIELLDVSSSESHNSSDNNNNINNNTNNNNNNSNNDNESNNIEETSSNDTSNAYENREVHF